MSPDDRWRVAHMSEAAEQALAFVAGRKRADLDQNAMLRLALTRAVEILGEAASKVSETGHAELPAVPWVQVVGMRNRLVHAYFDIFDYDPSHLPFVERAKLTLAKAIYGDQVPNAALCYVWDARLPAGKIMPNPFTASVRMIVVRGTPAEPGRWTEEHRDIASDFREAFGEDPPTATGIIVGADTDNTGDHALGWVGDIRVTAH